MAKISFVFTKEMAELLKKVRKNAGLFQKEVAKRIGLSNNSFAYISFLESCKIKNPSLGGILLYLRACGASWIEFFKELDAIDFKMRHKRMIAQLPRPPEKRKIERDVMRYEAGIAMPSKEKEDIDFNRLKERIKDKVTILLTKEQVAFHQSNSYQKFALEYFVFLAELNKAGMKMITEKYQKAGLQFHLLSKIKKVINSVLRAEIKRLEAKKPLPTEKQERMAIGFTKYRIKIEQIEAEVHKLLCELGVSPPWFALYKDFARQYYKTLKRYYGKSNLTTRLTEIGKRWVGEGLKEDVLLKISKAIEKILEKV